MSGAACAPSASKDHHSNRAPCGLGGLGSLGGTGRAGRPGGLERSGWPWGPGGPHEIRALGPCNQPTHALKSGC